MHGIVFTQLKSHVVDEAGRDAWTAVVESVEEGRQAYLPVRAYPDEEFGALLSAAADEIRTDEQSLQRAFGRDLGAELYGTYASQIDADWGYFDLLEHVETVHGAAREGGDADPPRLESSREGPEEVRITYASNRQLCDVGKGIARGLADEYGVGVAVDERTCMHEGARECELVVESA